VHFTVVLKLQDVALKILKNLRFLSYQMKEFIRIYIIFAYWWHVESLLVEQVDPKFALLFVVL